MIYIEHLILSPEIILFSYQMIHELLFNIVKHAQTNLAYVSLKRVKQDLHIQVKDEGIGFDSNFLQQGLINNKLDSGLGLSSMQNRLNMINGHIM